MRLTPELTDFSEICALPKLTGSILKAGGNVSISNLICLTPVNMSVLNIRFLITSRQKPFILLHVTPIPLGYCTQLFKHLLLGKKDTEYSTINRATTIISVSTICTCVVRMLSTSHAEYKHTQILRRALYAPNAAQYYRSRHPQHISQLSLSPQQALKKSLPFPGPCEILNKQCHTIK